MKKLWKEFVTFINKGNALALAIGVIIGGAFTSIVSAINTKIISPLIGAVCGDYDLSNSLVTVLKWATDADGNKILDEAGNPVVLNGIYWGAFIQSVIDFLLTAIILFAIFKICTAIINASKRAAERAKELLSKEEASEEVSEEAEEVIAQPEPVIPEDIKLLQEIRDLLANKQASKEE